MQIRVLTLRYGAALGGFDDEPLTTFVREHRVLAVHEHFFEVDSVPHLACVVRWQEEEAASGQPPAPRPGRSRRAPHDPTAELDEQARPVFEALRAWRRERAREDGLPAYNVLTDRQLASLARSRPLDTQALAEVDGLGEGKRRLFGADLLAVLAAAAGTGAEAKSPGRPA